MPDKKPRRPNDATIKKVIEHLEEYGLSLYGRCIDLESGAMYASQMDYDFERYVKLRKLEDKGELWEYDEREGL